MKNLSPLFVLALLSLLFTSCEEVIPVDLKTADEKYVIEATLTNQLGGATVFIGKTKNVGTSNNFNGEFGAVITIEDKDGKISKLTESTINKGVYNDPFLKGVPEANYKLKIEINGQTFTASSRMPAVVKLDNVYSTETSGLDGQRKFTNVKFKDPAGKGNAYRFVEYRNGVYNKVITVANDDLFDGNAFIQVLSPKTFTDDTKYVTGDKIKVDFLTIDNAVYKYWACVDGGIQKTVETAAPINPVSNINGGAIGYFSAHTIQTKEYIVK